MWSRPVYRAWLEMELLTDLRLPAELDHRTLMDAIYLAPVMPWIDPAKEADGWKTQIRGGAATETEWIRARGRNPDEVRRQRVQELDYNRKNGIVTDTDPANDSGANTNESGNQTAQPTDGSQGSGRTRSRASQQ